MKNVKLIIDSPIINSSLIYKTNFNCLDPIIYLDNGIDLIAWLPSTELEKAKKISNYSILFNLSDELKKIKAENKYPYLKSSIVFDWLNNNNIKEIIVPENFPVIEAENLKNNGFKINIKNEPFYEDRLIKTELEINCIKKNSLLNIEVMQEVYTILAESIITNDNKIKYKNEILTSEWMQNYILKSFIDKNLIADSVIVASGDQGCFPHENGSGFLYANTSIIVDIFPRNRSNFYYSDMTRTFCKGKANNALKNIYNTVLEAQLLGLELIHAREVGKKIHQKIQGFFENKNYKTGIIKGILQGFFHGTGHGLGLDCHELPYINDNGGILEKNSVVSVEPGLYYIGVGAVRIEDIVVVKNNHCEILTNFEKKLEIE